MKNLVLCILLSSLCFTSLGAEESLTLAGALAKIPKEAVLVAILGWLVSEILPHVKWFKANSIGQLVAGFLKWLLDTFSKKSNVK